MPSSHRVDGHQSYSSARHSKLAVIAVAVWGILVATRTLKVMAQQTETLSKTLDASIASERAWVMVDLEKPETGFLLDGQTQEKFYTSASVICNCVNQGKTPARLTEIMAGMIILESIDSLDSLPEAPDFDAMKMRLHTPKTLAAGEPARCKLEVTCEGNRPWGQVAVIYGIAKYRHMFSDREVQTSFGYVVSPSDLLLRLVDHPKYNENS